jgi:hypothetical protein
MKETGADPYSATSNRNKSMACRNRSVLVATADWLKSPCGLVAAETSPPEFPAAAAAAPAVPSARHCWMVPRCRSDDIKATTRRDDAQIGHIAFRQSLSPSNPRSSGRGGDMYCICR